MQSQLRLTILFVLSAFAVASATAQSGGAEVYKSKCQACHGVRGMADSSAGIALRVKPVTHPDVKKMSEAEMINAVRNGMGKMQAYKGKLTDSQIMASVTFFRAFLK
jgi:cytochrome c6